MARPKKTKRNVVHRVNSVTTRDEQTSYPGQTKGTYWERHMPDGTFEMGPPVDMRETPLWVDKFKKEIDVIRDWEFKSDDDWNEKPGTYETFLQEFTAEGPDSGKVLATLGVRTPFKKVSVAYTTKVCRFKDAPQLGAYIWIKRKSWFCAVPSRD